MQAVDPSPDCGIADCVVCGVSAGRCDGVCPACDLIDHVFPAYAGTFGRCLDVCECVTCDTRRNVVREHAQRRRGDTTDQVPSGS